METLATITRHIITYLIGMLVAWLAIYLTGENLKAATDAANALIEPLVIIAGFVGVIVARLAMPILDRIFRRGAGENEGGNHGGGSGMSLLLMACVMAGGVLPSCTPSFPIMIGYSRDGFQVQAVIPASAK